MAVGVDSSGTDFELGPRNPMFPFPTPSRSDTTEFLYTPSRDGTRFLVTVEMLEATALPFVVRTNWWPERL